MATSLTPAAIETWRESPSCCTFLFHLERQFDYLPGQYLTLKLAEVDDPRGPQRPFTLSSSPTETDHICVTVKMTGSPFKETLLAIAEAEDKPVNRVQLRGPLGEFTMDAHRPAVMIAGGIGITPFRSMIRYAADSALMLPITLLYSNETPADIAFRDELDKLAEQNNSLTVAHTITGDAAGWPGRTGRIDAGLIAEYGKQLDDPVYYLCGPPAMVQAVDNILQNELDIPASDRRTEKFSGY